MNQVAIALQIVSWAASMSSLGSTSGNLTGEILDQVLQLREAIEDLHSSVGELKTQINQAKKDIVHSIYDESARNRADQIEASIDACGDIISEIVELRENYNYREGSVSEELYKHRTNEQLSTLNDHLSLLERDRRVITNSSMGLEDMESLSQAWPMELRVRRILFNLGFDNVFSEIKFNQMQTDYIEALTVSLGLSETNSIESRLQDARSSQAESLAKLRQDHFFRIGMRCAYIMQNVRPEDWYHNARIKDNRVPYAYWYLQFGAAIKTHEFESIEDNPTSVEDMSPYIRQPADRLDGPRYNLFTPQHGGNVSCEMPSSRQEMESWTRKNCTKLGYGIPDLLDVPGWRVDGEFPLERRIDYLRKHIGIAEKYLRETDWHKEMFSQYSDLESKIADFNLQSVRREIFIHAKNRAMELRGMIAAEKFS